MRLASLISIPMPGMKIEHLKNYAMAMVATLHPFLPAL
jgi:hypothetical protein